GMIAERPQNLRLATHGGVVQDPKSRRHGHSREDRHDREHADELEQGERGVAASDAGQPMFHSCRIGRRTASATIAMIPIRISMIAGLKMAKTSLMRRGTSLL